MTTILVVARTKTGMQELVRMVNGNTGPKELSCIRDETRRCCQTFWNMTSSKIHAALAPPPYDLHSSRSSEIPSIVPECLHYLFTLHLSLTRTESKAT